MLLLPHVYAAEGAARQALATDTGPLSPAQVEELLVFLTRRRKAMYGGRPPTRAILERLKA
jgi:hypothetical protein